MKFTYIWSAIVLPLSIKAISIERDSCSNIRCDAPGCNGTNNFLPDGRGQCFEGACAGEPCLSICPSTEISCNQFDCAALYGGDNAAWTCSSGDYAGCQCSNSCPTTLLKCSEAACNGSSNSVNQYGICGSPLLSDCPCINSCPSSPGPCSDNECLGSNNPSGANSVCTGGSQLGCSCESNCPATIGCNDKQCQGYNNPNDPTKSYCTAGSYVGCRCKSTCGLVNVEGVFGLNLCTANGCDGINNLNGNEFCTAGEFRGCHCSSACPSTPLKCSDTTNCDGFEGLCTFGNARGCTCTGSSALKKRRPTRTIIARATPTSGVDSHIPSAYYVCGPRGQSSVNSNQGTRSYPRQQLQQAINAGFMLSIEDLAITAGNGRQYPQRFYIRGPNAANFNIPTNNRQINPNRLVEFPIIRNSAGQYVPLTVGGDPGPDRVVFDGTTGYFAGVFTHRGEVNNNFHRAPGHDQEVNESVIEVDFTPTILETNPFNWFSGGSGDPFPLKRSPTYPPASFPTTFDGCPTGNGQCYCYNTITVAGWYPRNAALQAIDQACSDWSDQTVPLTNSIDNIQTLSSNKQVVYDNTEWSIEMSVWQTLLADADTSTVNQQSCITALRSAIDNCQTNTDTEKIGGEYQVYISGVGSQQYIIHPGNGNPNPTKSNNSEPFNT